MAQNKIWKKYKVAIIIIILILAVFGYTQYNKKQTTGDWYTTYTEASNYCNLVGPGKIFHKTTNGERWCVVYPSSRTSSDCGSSGWDSGTSCGPIYCTDTDGSNYNTKGSVTTQDGTFYDVCQGNTLLTEYSCSNKQKTTTTIDCGTSGCSSGKCNPIAPVTCTPACGSGYTCVGTTCVRQGDPITCYGSCMIGQTSSCSSDNSAVVSNCINNNGNYCWTQSVSCGSGFSCSNGACVRPASCTDTDGSNYNTKGSVTTQDGTFTDGCTSSTILLEYECSNNLKTTLSVDCGSVGCTDGKCNPIAPVTCTPACGSGYTCMDGQCITYAGQCTDSDGSNYNIKGTVTTSDGVFTDTCLANTLTEYECSNNLKTTLTVDCGSVGCTDGKCNPIVPVTCNPACGTGYACISGTCITQNDLVTYGACSLATTSDCNGKDKLTQCTKMNDGSYKWISKESCPKYCSLGLCVDSLPSNPTGKTTNEVCMSLADCKDFGKCYATSDRTDCENQCSPISKWDSTKFVSGKPDSGCSGLATWVYYLIFGIIGLIILSVVMKKKA